MLSVPWNAVSMGNSIWSHVSIKRIVLIGYLLVKRGNSAAALSARRFTTSTMFKEQRLTTVSVPPGTVMNVLPIDCFELRQLAVKRPH